jgi:hypothetical protein
MSGYIVRFLRDHPVQVTWCFVCLVMGIVGSLIGGFLGQLIF